MIRGRITRRLEPRVRIGLVGRRVRSLDVIVDTGFSGYLLLSRRHRERLSLSRVATDEFELADGRIRRVPVYLGRIVFDGKIQPVLVALTNSSDSLIGASLMKDRTLTVSYAAKTVTIL